MRQILIPTDFSDNSQNAIRFAMNYFSGIPVTFHLLHVSPKPMAAPDPFLGIPKMGDMPTKTQSAASKLKLTVQQCMAETTSKKHYFFDILENVSLVEAIRKQVAEKSIDFILMGTKGASNVYDSEIGSNTAEVITKVKCPILVIPEQVTFQGIRNIAFPTDYNCLYKNKVVKTLYETLNQHSAHLNIISMKPRVQNLSTYQADNKHFLQEFLKNTDHSFHYLENKNIEMGVQQFVESTKIDMIALIAKNVNLVQRLLFRPIVKGITYHREIPFLVIHE